MNWDFISQKTTFFILAAVKTSDFNIIFLYGVATHWVLTGATARRKDGIFQSPP
jgi:hypothetical protein